MKVTIKVSNKQLQKAGLKDRKATREWLEALDWSPVVDAMLEELKKNGGGK